MFENGVYIGSDGWLFLAGGTNDVQRLYCSSDFLTDQDILTWRSRLTERQSRLAGAGILYLHAWVPEKISVYNENIGSDFPIVQDTPARRISSPELDRFVLDLTPVFRSAKSDKLLYWKTDTHWTYWGALVAYETICGALNIAPNAALWKRPIHEVLLSLDLGSKLNPVQKEMWGMAQVLRNAKITYKNEMVRFLELLNNRYQSQLHSGTSVIYENDAPTADCRVLVFGDSYCEYRPHLLAGSLAETFRTVQFVWSSSIDYHLVESFRPNVVITQMAERFVKRIPTDDLNLTGFVFERIAGFLNRECGASRHYFTHSSRRED